MIQTVVRSFSARLLSLPLIAVAGIIGSRLVIDGLGTEGFAVYSLVIGMAALLPFADLGVGVALMDTTARTKNFRDLDFSRALLASLRTLIAAALTLSVIAWSLAVTGTWSQVLGLPSSAQTQFAVASALTSFAIVLPSTIGPRMLTGLGKNHQALALQAVGAALGLGPISLAYALQLPLWVYTTSPFLGNLIGNLIALFMVHRRVSLPLGDITFSSLTSRHHRKSMIRGVAAPMVIITIILPLAYQTDRIIISHQLGLISVAQYSLVLQLYSPLISIVGGAGIALWPIFVNRSDAISVVRTFYQSMAVFAGGGTVLALALIFVGPPIAHLISKGQISPGFDLWLSFGAMLFIQSSSYPLAMYLTKPGQLWFQAKLHIVMLLVNLPLSFATARVLGAAGPVISSCIAIVATLYLPQLARARRDLARPDPADSGHKSFDIAARK